MGGGATAPRPPPLATQLHQIIQFLVSYQLLTAARLRFAKTTIDLEPTSLRNEMCQVYLKTERLGYVLMR